MLFDRRPFYLIGGAAGLVLAAILFLALPKITPEDRVKEQLTLLATEPWTPIQIEQVQYVGGAGAEQAVVRGVRLDTNTPVRVHFIAKSPYTSPSAMNRLTERALDGQRAEVLMLPRSITFEPFRSQFDPAATHAGVALFAGFVPPPTPVTPASGDMSVESAAPPATPAAPAAAPAVPPAPAPAQPAAGTHG